MIKYIPSVLGIILLFTLFGFVHSLLASLKIKKKLAKWLGSKIAFYRVFYNIISVLTFAFVYEVSPHPDIIIYDLPNPFDLIILVTQFISLIGAFWSFKYFSGQEFLGIAQVKRYLNNNYQPGELDEKMSFRLE